MADWKSTILHYYDNVEMLLETEYEESDKTGFLQKITEDILNEPIGMSRAKYKELLKDIKKCTEKSSKVEERKRHLESFKEYLDSELVVKEVDEKVKLYK